PFSEIRESLETVAGGIDKQGNRLVDEFGKLASLADSIGEQRDRSNELRLDASRYRAGRLAERFGGDTTSYLGAGGGQLPFLQTQQRLTGLAGANAIDPAQILGRAIASQAGARRA